MKPIFMSLAMLILGTTTFFADGGTDGSPKKKDRASAANGHAGNSAEAADCYGCRMQPVPPELAAHLDPEVWPGTGVVITTVHDNSAAATCGLRKFDILLQYNDETVCSEEQFQAFLSQSQPGTEVLFKVIRNGHSTELLATLGRSQTAENSQNPSASSGAPAEIVTDVTAIATGSGQATISRSDSGRVQIEVRYLQDNSRRHKIFAGSPKELEPEISRLPDSLARLIREQLTSQRSPTFRSVARAESYSAGGPATRLSTATSINAAPRPHRSSGAAIPKTGTPQRSVIRAGTRTTLGTASAWSHVRASGAANQNSAEASASARASVRSGIRGYSRRFQN